MAGAAAQRQVDLAEIAERQQLPPRARQARIADPELVAAAERLREDFELAQMGPRVAQNWERFLTVGSDRGMSRITRADYPAVLTDLIGSNLPADAKSVPTVICGMAGARQGWVEAPYRSVPCTPLDRPGLIAAPTSLATRS